MTKPAGIEPARTYIDSLKNGDIDGATAALHPDVVIHEPADLPYGGDWHGREGYLALLTKATSDYELTIHSFELWPGGDDVAIMRGQATFRAISTGAAIDTTFTEICKITDGLLSDIDVYLKDVAAVRNLLEYPPAGE